MHISVLVSYLFHKITHPDYLLGKAPVMKTSLIQYEKMIEHHDCNPSKMRLYAHQKEILINPKTETNTSNEPRFLVSFILLCIGLLFNAIS
jgi:hypothetical protein